VDTDLADVRALHLGLVSVQRQAVVFTATHHCRLVHHLLPTLVQLPSAASGTRQVSSLVISFILFGFNMHFFFTYDLLPVTSTVGNETVVHYHSCSFHDWFEDFMIGPWYWIDALLGDFIPFTIVFSGNCAIVTKIIASKRLRAVTAKDDKGSRKVRDVYCNHQWN